MGIDILRAMAWGIVATGILTLILSGSQGAGWSRISIPYLIGTVFTPRRDRAMILGIVIHLLFGSLFALAYAFVFGRWGASWWKGTVLGLYHGLFMLLVFLRLLPFLHPRMASLHHGPTPTRQLEPPGFMGLHYGRATPAISLVAHLVYGAILGVGY